MTLLEAVQASYLSKGLTTGQVERLLTISQVENRQAGQPLVTFNDESSDLLILITGRATVTSSNNDFIDEVGPGSLLGEISLIDRETRSANVTCLDDCEIMILPGDQLREAMESDLNMAAKVFLNISRVLASRLRKANLQMGHLGGARSENVSEVMWNF